MQHSQFGQHDRPIWQCALQRLSQPSEAAIGYLNIPRGLSQRFGCSGAFAAAFPQASSPRGKGVWLFPPLGSPAFPSGVGPLMSLIPVKAIRAVGVCVVDTGPAGSDGFRNDRNFVNRDFVKDAVKANTGAWLYAAVGFQMP